LFGPAHPTRLSFTTTRELDGFCFLTRGGQKNFKLIQAIGYDPASKKLVEIGFDNLGGRWTETADSATPENVVFSGTYKLNDREIAVRDTFSIKERDFSHLGEIRTGSEWKKLNEEKCVK
jgi:hypothetical protein